MNVTDSAVSYDTNADLRRLLDAGYEVRLTSAPAAFGNSAAGPEYMATITSGMGSDWRGVGASPADALRSVWPLGYGNGQGGCGHCCGMGCTVPDCPVCAAYGEPLDGTCRVCGYADPDADETDDLEPYCSACGADIGIFWGHGDDWHHWRSADGGRTEIYDAGHAPALAWREGAAL